MSEHHTRQPSASEQPSRMTAQRGTTRAGMVTNQPSVSRQHLDPGMLNLNASSRAQAGPTRQSNASRQQTAPPPCATVAPSMGGPRTVTMQQALGGSRSAASQHSAAGSRVPSMSNHSMAPPPRPSGRLTSMAVAPSNAPDNASRRSTASTQTLTRSPSVQAGGRSHAPDNASRHSMAMVPSNAPDNSSRRSMAVAPSNAPDNASRHSMAMVPSNAPDNSSRRSMAVFLSNSTDNASRSSTASTQTLTRAPSVQSDGWSLASSQPALRESYSLTYEYAYAKVSYKGPAPRR